MARVVGAAGSVVAAMVAAAVALVVAACTTSVPGQAVRAPGHPTGRVSAQDLLLHDGDTTPLGAATSAEVGDSYFTSARPPECAAALLFVNSPLVPSGAADHAESSYRFGTSALYAEAVDLYDRDLNEHDVVWDGFGAVSKCQGDASGVSPTGPSPPFRLSFFSTGDGVLTWTMTRPDWTCDYGLAVVPRVALLLSACDAQPGFPMADWAVKRRSQLAARTA
ncbi:hypothetical protein [Mycobacterium sp. 050134]|uniref:hypothetical protein n=1 Tax=Mycobacterium sp. 050134 TaxID=3096111 RepID=UPI002ED83096